MKTITEHLPRVLAAKSLPGITIWNRLEGRPRADRFERALRAEVRDPLWMITRQWQMGEFRGDDAGSPITARVRVETTQLERYQAASGVTEPLDPNVPLEAKVERLPLSFEQQGTNIALDLRLVLGRHWMKLIHLLPAEAREQYLNAYPIVAPDPLIRDNAPICAHPEAWSTWGAVAGRRMDGYRLYAYLKSDPSHRASDGIAALVGLEGTADALGERLVTWFERLIDAPQAPSAWLPERLEYQFACSAPVNAEGAEKVYVAEQYHHGHLDWYNFDVDPARKSLLLEGGDGAPSQPPIAKTLSMLPTQVTFNGMPNTRYWAFEDGRTNFGDIKPDTTDLGKLLLIEFGLVYANDWYQIPFTVPPGTISTVKGMLVTNVFGERIWIEAAGRGDDDDWQRWAMFLVNVRGKGHEAAETSLLIPPVAHNVLESAPRDEVMLARDEMANMVWGVEKTVTLPSGQTKRGADAARETRLFFERELERRLGSPGTPPELAEGAKIRYQVMSSVPEHWIPMIPVHVPGDTREVQLQRAAMPRILDGDTESPVPVRPRTSLLRHGLEADPPRPYFLHEEEVSRAGALVKTSFQRTRHRNGRVWIWFGARKQTGRGEGSSGLSFDRIIEGPKRRT
jgi:hypothetical protein